MTDAHSQSLSETFTRIIKMILVSWRAQSVRSLSELAMALAITFEIYGIFRELAALMAAFKAGKLPALKPARERASGPAPQAASPRPAATPREAAARARASAPARAPSPRPAPPAIARIARPGRVPAFVAPPRPLPTPLLRVPTPLSRKNSVWAALPSHVLFIAYS